MNLEFVPLLRLQREIYEIPRGRERFLEYLRVMQNDRRDDIRLPPLVAMNPMAKDHAKTLLDTFLALDADGIAARAVEEASLELAAVPGDYKVALVLADDAMGGWTNRYDVEFTHRFESQTIAKRGWLSGILWTSEEPSVQEARAAVLTSVHRAAYIQTHGAATTLGERLAQEGHAMAAAGRDSPVLDAEDLSYTREVIAEYRDARDRRTNIECLFGDPAARCLGFTPRGLSPWAGLALALHEARLSAGAARVAGHSR